MTMCEGPILSEEQKDWVERKFSEDEIKQAVFGLGEDKAPRPDGFSMFTKCWDTNKSDLLKVFEEFTEFGRICKGMNSPISFLSRRQKGQRPVGFQTYLALLPVFIRLSQKSLLAI